MLLLLLSVNPARDDGVTSVDGKPASSLLGSFLAVTAAMSEIMRPAERLMLLNDEIYRVDMLGSFDGVFSEYGDLSEGKANFEKCGAFCGGSVFHVMLFFFWFRFCS